MFTTQITNHCQKYHLYNTGKKTFHQYWHSCIYCLICAIWWCKVMSCLLDTELETNWKYLYQNAFRLQKQDRPQKSNIGHAPRIKSINIITMPCSISTFQNLVRAYNINVSRQSGDLNLSSTVYIKLCFTFLLSDIYVAAKVTLQTSISIQLY